MNVLVTDAVTKQALAITQSLGRRGIDVTCISSEFYSPAFYSKFCKKHFVAPRERDKDGFISFVQDLVKKERYELVITCSDLSTEYLSEARGRLLPYTKLALPEHDKILTVLNKDRLMQFCQKNGFPAPITLYPENLNEALSLSAKVGYPVVLKGTRGTAAANVRFVKTENELEEKYLELQRLGLKIIIQEFVGGEFLDFDGMYVDGIPVARFMFKAIRTFPKEGGNTSKAISVYNEQLKILMDGIFKSLRWTGVVNVDCKIDAKTSEIKIIDINPRFGGPIAFAIACGVDIPNLLYDAFVHEKKEEPKPYKLNKIFRSLFREEVLYAYYRPQSAPKMLLEMLNPFVNYGFHFNDLKAFIMLLKNTKWEIEYRTRMQQNKF